MKNKLSNIDHIAIQVKDVSRSVKYYTKRFDCDIFYNDDTWALLRFENINLALVSADEHPNHFAIVDKNISKSSKIKYHRDGVGFIYTRDLDGNFIEILDRKSY